MRKLYDIAVVGAGVAGVAAATRLALDGHAVLLLASHAHHPREFRTEKFGAYEAKLLDRLGLWDASRSAMTCFDEVLLGKWGEPVERIAMQEYSVRYPDLVDALRNGAPDRIDHEIGRVARVEAGVRGQELVMADGSRRHARLVVLATGLMEGLRRELGMGKATISRAHSLVFGFDVAAAHPHVPFQSLTWQGERFGDGIAYLTLFPLDRAMRANLFTYWEPAGIDAAAFVRDPAGEVASRLPGFSRLYGRFLIDGLVEQRSIDLVALENHELDGVVVIGDAFCTSCPSTGTGIRKVLTDVDRLAAHAQRWLATPGMKAGKIASFYADPVKTACDHDSLARSLNGRRMLVDRSAAWRFRRLRSYVYRRGRHELGQLGFKSVLTRVLGGA